MPACCTRTGAGRFRAGQSVSGAVIDNDPAIAGSVAQGSDGIYSHNYETSAHRTHNGLRGLSRRGAAALQLRQNRMAHASEILADIAKSGLHYVEVPVTVNYTAYSLQKGQRAGDFLMVLLDLFAQRLYR
jgi:hypothetical protein